MGTLVMFAVILLAVASPAKASPMAGLHYLVGTWSCTYRAGTTSFPYTATYAYESGGNRLRQVATWTGGGDEELYAYDAQHRAWSSVVFDDQGNATVMRAAGTDPNHIAFRSVYPDANLAVTYDRVSSTVYTLHGAMRMSGKTTTNVDTCKLKA